MYWSIAICGCDIISGVVNRPLSGHVAIVTGASSGIGAAISVALASSGVSVAMAARREDLLLGIEKRICDDGGVAISVRTDITDRLQVCLMSSFSPVFIGSYVWDQ